MEFCGSVLHAMIQKTKLLSILKIESITIIGWSIACSSAITIVNVTVANSYWSWRLGLWQPHDTMCHTLARESDGPILWSILHENHSMVHFSSSTLLSWLNTQIPSPISTNRYSYFHQLKKIKNSNHLFHFVILIHF